MTGYAFKIVELVLYKCYLIFLYCFMASRAGNMRVFAIQFETGFVMVEMGDGPSLKAVALGAIDGAICGKLPIVGVLMAIGAAAGFSRKLPVFMYLVRHVASAAVLLGVCPLQGKGRLVVVEMVVSPTCYRVAFFTGLIGVPTLRYLPLVDVLVAIHTARPDVFKDPSVVFEVAGETGGGHMRPFESERR